MDSAKRVLTTNLGFVPSIFLAQAGTPQLVEAEVHLLDEILFQKGFLPRLLKERILREVALEQENEYCFGLHSQMMQLCGGASSVLPQREKELFSFIVKLTSSGFFLNADDLTKLSSIGWPKEALLEAVLTVGIGMFLCSLAKETSAAPEFPRWAVTKRPFSQHQQGQEVIIPREPYFGFVEFDESTCEHLTLIYGRVPMFYRVLSSYPRALEAVMGLLTVVQSADTASARLIKQSIILNVSLANFNTYWVTLLESLGVADLETSQNGVAQPVVIALANLLNTLQFGLGVPPDLPPLRILKPGFENIVYLSPVEQNPTLQEDPDAHIVGLVKQGELELFAELIQRHSQQVYRTLAGILSSPEEARDAMQDTFLKAFQHLSNFQGRSKFSTWLLTIATNTALQRIRERRPEVSLDIAEDEDFRPRQVRAWTNNPEQLYAKEEINRLVEASIRQLPLKYRTVVVLRDLQQLSTEEAAAVLDISIPALKARLIRGRLMLREALTPHFDFRNSGVAH